MEYVKKVGIGMILIGNGRVITNDENERIIENGCIAVSYTHLDVYKRQELYLQVQLVMHY